MPDEAAHLAQSRRDSPTICAMLRAVSRAPRRLPALTAAFVLALACTSQSEGLEQRAAGSAPSSPAAPTPAPEPAPTPAPATAPRPSLPPSSATPGDLVTLRLALPDGARYRLTTVGMIHYPMMPQPTGFAREESIDVRECRGDGLTRACALEHRVTNFEAEPPYGKFIDNDEAPVRALVSRQRMTVLGAPEGPATIDGEGAATEAGRALSAVHRFACIRFPSEPVAVGATWTVTCDSRVDGRVAHRTTTWELIAIDDDPEGAGKRAELRETGSFTFDSTAGARGGEFAGILYFWVDLGEPHILRETLVTEIVADQGSTKASINYQFAKVDPNDPTKVTRTDGKPFEEPAAPAAAP